MNEEELRQKMLSLAQENERLRMGRAHLVVALSFLEDRLAFHEVKSGGGRAHFTHPPVEVNGEDFEEMLDKARDALAKARGEP